MSNILLVRTGVSCARLTQKSLGAVGVDFPASQICEKEIQLIWGLRGKHFTNWAKSVSPGASLCTKACGMTMSVRMMAHRASEPSASR